MNNRSDNQKVEVGRERERENGWGRKVQGDDSAWGLYLMRRFHFLKKVSQLIIAPAYISDCYSSVVSTSRQLIKAFLFSPLYTWTSVGSSQEKLPLCCTTIEALLHSAITSTRPSGSISISSHIAICSLVWVPVQWVAEFCLLIKIQTVISGTQKGSAVKISHWLGVGIENRHIPRRTLLQPRGNTGRSQAWLHFRKAEKKKNTLCNRCNAIISCSGAKTTDW